MADTFYSPAGPVTKAFLKSDAFFKSIMGPVGSGKSTACVIDLLRNSAMQEPGPDGVRRTRHAIIRNSYPELKSTTIRTWNQWCPKEFGKTNMSAPITHRIITPDMDMEILFLVIDREEDAKKLLSLELTKAWLNEARELPKGVVDLVTTRVGRYPSKGADGVGPTNYGVIMDTNPPDTENYYYHLAEEETPEDFRFFKQPGGRSPDAENLENLPKKYYDRLIQGKDPDWIKVYCDGEYGFVAEGRPVYPMYRDSVHCAEKELKVMQGVPVQIGYDFGLMPAAVFTQRLANGSWVVLRELCADDCGMFRFAERLTQFVAEYFPNNDIVCWPDPAGGQRSPIDERKAIDVLKGITPDYWRWGEVQTNDFGVRRDAVVNCLNRLVDGAPGIVISSACRMLRKGFVSGYHFKVQEATGGPRPAPTPDKNDFSHPHDALQYAVMGGGEYDLVMSKPERKHKDRQRQAEGTGMNPYEEHNIKPKTSMLEFGIRPVRGDVKKRPTIASGM